MIAALKHFFARTLGGSVAQDPLDSPLLHLGREVFRVRDACEGILVLGATGSGKTSGSLSAIARSFLLSGYGGLVLCTKREEPDLWRRYARQTGRQHDLIFFGPRYVHRFNYLSFAAELTPPGVRPTENLTQLLGAVIDVANRGQSSGSQDPYWSRAAQQLIRNAIDLVLLSRGTKGLTLQEIYQIIVTAPVGGEQLRSRDWQRSSRCMQLLDEAHRRPQIPIAAHDRALTSTYWLKEFANLSPRTRGCVISMVTTGIEPLLRGTIYELTNSRTTITPTATHMGKIVVLDLPAKVYHSSGILTSLIWKQLWQIATEARRVEDKTCPVFIFCDEAQVFVTAADASFLMTARSSRASSVYATQNLPNFRSALGKTQTDALIGNLVTRIFHANSCAETNEWASQSISKSWQFRTSIGTSRSDTAAGEERLSHSSNLSDSHEYQVPAEEFLGLRRGGPSHDLRVDAIVARPWPRGRGYVRATFKQT